MTLWAAGREAGVVKDFPVIGGRYEAERVLGQGRLSVVYRARDRETGGVVAVKVLQAHLRVQASVVQRFKREMAAVQRLEHGAIVRVFDVVETAEHVALVMEFAVGEDLKSWVLGHGKMEPARVERLASTLLEAVGHAHARGVLHRDLHLGNVVLDEANDDRIEIIGFGLARVDELVSLTMHTRVLGALETMAPEAVLGKAMDAQADIFSVGAMLYELLVGRPLHDGRMSSALAFASGAHYLADVRERLEGVLGGDYPGLLAAVMRALVPDPTLRFATAGQMRDALVGNYDAGVWQALESQKVRDCSQCKRALLEGFEACVYCGHAPEFLLKDTNAGEHIVQVVIPDTAASGVAYALSSKQLKDLYDMMFSHEETKYAFQVEYADRFPPYVLFERLSKTDAEHISELLWQKNIHNKIGTSKLKELQGVGRRTSFGHRFKTFCLNGLVIFPAIASFAVLFCLVFVEELGLRESFAAELPVIRLLVNPDIHSFNPVVISIFSFASICAAAMIFFVRIDDGAREFFNLEKKWERFFSWGRAVHAKKINRFIWWPAAIVAVGVGGYLLYQLGVQDKILGSELMEIVVGVSAVLFAIGTMVGFVYGTSHRRFFSLARHLEGEVNTEPKLYRGALNVTQDKVTESVVPEQVLKTLQKLDDSVLQQDFHGLLVLVARMFQDKRVPAHALQEVLTPLWSKTTALFEELAEHNKTVYGGDAEALLSSMSALDAEVDSSLDFGRVGGLLAEREVYLEKLDVLDQSVHKASLLRGHLLEVRATLLNVQSQFGQIELPSIELVKDEIDALQFDFEARHEVHALLEGA